MLIIIYLVTFAIAFLILNKLYPKAEKRLKLEREKKVNKASAQLDNLFVDVQRRKVVMLITSVPIALGAVGFFAFNSLPIAAVFAGFGLVLPSFIIKSLEAGRKKKFNNQLIDALMLLTASLKAGLSLVQAFEELVEEMPPPLSQEFSLLIKEINMGVSFEESIMHLRKRMHSEDLDLIVTAISIARETGGELPSVFSKLVFTIKERQTLRGKVDALTIQGKLQGVIMGLLPGAFIVAVYKFNPEHFQTFLQDSLGRMLIVYAMISWIIGGLLIIKFSKVEI